MGFRSQTSTQKGPCTASPSGLFRFSGPFLRVLSLLRSGLVRGLTRWCLCPGLSQGCSLIISLKWARKADEVVCPHLAKMTSIPIKFDLFEKLSHCQRYPPLTLQKPYCLNGAHIVALFPLTLWATPSYTQAHKRRVLINSTNRAWKRNVWRNVREEFVKAALSISR